jgi:DNA-binding XRE family transcriptional regulator
MSAHAKKRLTEIILKSSKGTKSFRIPKKEEGKILKLLKPYEEETVSWRDVFEEDIEKYGEPGLALRGSRAKNNLTQTQLAEELGIEQSSISAMENGRRTIGKAMAKRLAKILNVDYRIFL